MAAFAQPDLPERRMDALAEHAYAYLKKYLPYNDAHAIYMDGQKIVDLAERTLFYSNVVVSLEERLHGSENLSDSLRDFAKYKWQPVGIEEFLIGKYYLDKGEEIYPVVLEELIKINSGDYVELLATGGIGSAKTTIALYTIAYQLYLLSCMRAPHRLFRMDSSSEILFIFQSITATLSKNVDYQRFRSMIEGCQYFRERFPFDKNIDSRLVFPHRIQVVPVSGADTAAIGQNVIGGLIDELNYMAVIEKSKKNVDAGTYDQAVMLYNSIARRRKSRFMSDGKLPGILCLVSSKKYPGQFTDSKEEEARREVAEFGKSTIYVYDKRVWEIKPAGTYTKGWFYVFVGDLARKPRILLKEETVADNDRELVVGVPMEYHGEFTTDIINALREVAGVSTLARHPYFLETEKVNKAFKLRHSVFSRDMVDFDQLRLSLRNHIFYRPELPRFAHVDLAISGDSAGVALGTVPHFVSVSGDQGTAMMPFIHIDGVLEVRPPKNAEIIFAKIRKTLMDLRKLGLNVRWVTFDTFQSTDSMQILRQQGFTTGPQSIDIVPCKPYDYLKGAVYDGRVDMPRQKHLLVEMLSLERDLKTGKIDHPPHGSKDCADALAGVVFGLTMRREIWGMHSVPLMMVPSYLIGPDKLEDNNKRLAPPPPQPGEMERVLTRAS